MSPTHAGSNTAKQILDLACELAQTRGYNAFSFRDLAQEIGIRSASVHHHFPTKADLGRAMIQRYRAQFAEVLEGIDRSRKSPSEKLRAYFDLFRQVARSDRGVCLGGMLAADILTLAAEVQTELNGFFMDCETWLRGVLEAGAASGDLSVTGSPGDVAVTIVSTLEGAMMVARVHGDAAAFDRACRWLLESLIRAFPRPG